jgi:hypothetical protein
MAVRKLVGDLKLVLLQCRCRELLNADFMAATVAVVYMQVA